MAATVLSQTLSKPVLKLGASNIACSDSSSKSFEVSFGSSGGFAADNKFTIQLSDGNGTWDSPTDVGTITTANSLLSFSSNFVLPNDTFGKNYKIRLISTSPETMSPDSKPFEAYKKFKGTLILNNFENVTLCNGKTAKLTLNVSEKGKYEWYKDGVLVQTTEEPVLENISQAGNYQVKIDYGACGFIDSTTIDVFSLTKEEQQIKGASVVQICGDQSHKFEANITDASYTYKWYLDTKLIHTSNTSTYTTPSAGQLGTYYLEIDTGFCVTKSDEVELTQKDTPSLTITGETPLSKLLLPGEDVDLSITVTGSSSYTVEWYKDDVKLFGASGNTLNVNQTGKYFANVIETVSGGGCVIVQSSKTMNLLAVKSVEPVIVADDTYEACNVTGVDMKLESVSVVAEDDKTYVLTSSQLSLLTYQWTVDGVNILGAKSDKLTRSSHIETGVYKLEITVGYLSDLPSNELDIKLIGRKPTVGSVPSSNSLCPGGDITYTINDLITGYTYQWFKDDDTTAIATDAADFVVKEVGSYSLKMTGFGCEKIIDTIEVVLFDDTVISVTPSEKVVLIKGEKVNVSASGAESYLWYEGEDTGGTLLSTSEVLEVDKLGFYTVVAIVGTCAVQKIIEVIEEDEQIVVPNIITPNGDGINDIWKVSNKYAFQPKVIIQIYNSDGKEILKTTEYQNNWPLEDLGSQQIFYYKIIREDTLIKAGTISVLE